MKKLLLTFCTFTLVVSAGAQYVKNAATGPKIGSTFSYAIDTLPQSGRGNAGPQQAWDLTDFDLDIDFSETYQDPQNSTRAADFPEADVITSDGFETRFYDVTPSGMNWIGVTLPDFNTGEEVPARLNPVEVIFEYPSTYLTSFANSSAYKISQAFDTTVTDPGSGTTFDIDSIRFGYESDKVVEWDAWGSLSTPYDNYPVTTRERIYQIVSNTFEVCIHNPIPVGPTCAWQDVTELSGFGGTDTSITYNWYGPESIFPLASIVYDYDDETPVYALVNTAPEFSSIGENDFVSGLIYPNPATDKVFIKGVENPESATISDITGKVVRKVELNGALSVSLEGLDAGNYIISVVAATGIQTGKISVIR